jgi:non-ribosomal peptide synthetase component E (peptide arylation enzyme)
MMQFTTVLKPELAQAYRTSGLWLNRTFFDIVEERARIHPDREVFADSARRISYGELKLEIEKCAEFFRGLGISRGDVVTVQLPNRIAFPVVFFALELIGAVANKVNPDFRSRELGYILKFSGSRAFVCPGEFKGFDYIGMAKGLQAEVPTLTHIVVAGNGKRTDGVFDLEAGIAASPPVSSSNRVHMDPDAVFRMAFTSGTTGDPKCVLHSFNTTLCTAKVLNEDMQLGENDVMLIYLPVGLNWGYLCLMQTIMAGARAVLLERFSARAALETIEREKVTYIATAPASIVAMLNDPDLAKFDVSSLRVVITGGASAAIETIRDFRARMKGHLVELYGMLETGFHTYTRLSDDPEKVSGTIGRVTNAMELRLIDESGNDVAPGEIGEVAARGPSVHLGYHNNPAANAQAFTADGWFRSGDLGRYVDSAGNIQLTGRSKEIINRGGKKFFPREVEEILYTHPKIMHAAVIGIPDARLGERNCLCVVPKPGQGVALPEVTSFLKGQVADYKLPEMVEIFEDLPMTGTGKIRRHILRDLVLERRSVRVGVIEVS